MKSLLIITAILAIGVQNNSVGYRGIVPLKSTRSDVERILGRPADTSDTTYYFPDKIIGIDYAKYGCAQPPRVEGPPRPPIEGWNVAPDTVLVVRVTLRTPVSLKDLNMDLKNFKKERGDSDIPSHFRYVNRESGLTIELNGDPATEIVRTLIYQPEAKYNHLRCVENKTTSPSLNY